MTESNYPDDIRSYDKDPRSPFFRDPPAAVCVCGEQWDEGPFYDKWLADLDPTEPLRRQHPEECPACEPKNFEEAKP